MLSNASILFRTGQSLPQVKRLSSALEYISNIASRAKGGAPSLVASFVILHELTAIVPFAATFWASRSFGFGNHIVHSLLTAEYKSFPVVQESLRSVVSEGEARIARIGSRYGVFG